MAARGPFVLDVDGVFPLDDDRDGWERRGGGFLGRFFGHGSAEYRFSGPSGQPLYCHLMGGLSGFA